MATMLDIGKRYKKTEAEVRDALAAINFAKRITVATKIESSVEQQLDAYWREQDAAANKSKEEAAPKPQLNRTIGRMEISERPRRVVKPPAPPTLKPASVQAKPSLPSAKAEAKETKPAQKTTASPSPHPWPLVVRAPATKSAAKKPTVKAAAKNKLQSMPRDHDVDEVLRNLDFDKWAKENGCSLKRRVCGKCTDRAGRLKRLFSEKDAALAIKYWHDIEGIEKKPYKCPHGNGVHLTTARRKR